GLDRHGGPAVRAAPARARAPVRHVNARAAIPVRSRRPSTAALCAASCPPSAVLAADRRLRSAYDHAIRAGVPTGVLADYRDRWADLRENAADRPRRLVQGYGELTRALGREATGARARPAQRKDPLWRSLVSWW
ncbi:MAG: hypothetical protein JWO72_669, partial [Caulobacteraceae bacterium]|nr:hypothetical protein [Caulobacteraceae bacterium]